MEPKRLGSNSSKKNCIGPIPSYELGDTSRPLKKCNCTKMDHKNEKFLKGEEVIENNQVCGTQLIAHEGVHSKLDPRLCSVREFSSILQIIQNTIFSKRKTIFIKKITFLFLSLLYYITFRNISHCFQETLQNKFINIYPNNDSRQTHSVVQLKDVSQWLY